MKDPTTWERILYGIIGWQTFKLPDAERLDLDSARDFSRVISSEPLDIPDGFQLITTGTSRYDQPNRAGITSGTPMQLGTRDRAVKSINVGRQEHGEQYRRSVPRPASGAYWPRGWPVPSFDRHLVIQDPVTRVVTELIQWDEDGWFNQARGWSEWLDRFKIGQGDVTATGYPLHATVWTPWSSERSHVCAMVVPDYLGADGTLTDTNLTAGSRLMLDSTTPSYYNNVARGGAAADLAQALAVHGARVIDRAGYDSALNPRPISIQVQTGRQWRGTNIDQFDVALGDFMVATEWE